MGPDVFLHVFLSLAPASPAPNPDATAPMDPDTFLVYRLAVSTFVAAMVGGIVLGVRYLIWDTMHPHLCVCGHKSTDHVSRLDYDAAGYIAGGDKKVGSCRRCTCRTGTASGKRA